MCKALLAGTVIAGVLLPLGHASAQSRLSKEAQVQKARVDSLVPLWMQAGARMQRDNELRRAHERARVLEPLDTLVIAPFIAVAQRSDSSKAFRLFRQAMQSRREALRGLANAPPITLLFEISRRYANFLELAKQPRHHIVSFASDVGQRLGQRMVGENIDDALRDLLPDSVRGWLRDGRLSAVNRDVDVMRELATTDAAVTKGCLRELAEDCIAALQLNATQDSLRGWTPAELRHLIARGGSGTFRTVLARRCVELRRDDACIEAFTMWGGPPLPLSTSARASLLRFAIQRGGVGALARLSGVPHATPAQALTIAAGVPLTGVVGAWRAQLDERHETPGAGLVTNASTGVVWLGLAVFFALRSTRRRLG